MTLRFFSFSSSNIKYDSRTGAGKLHALHIDMHICLWSTVQLPGASLTTVEVSFSLLEKFGTHRNTDAQTQTLGGVNRVAFLTEKTSNEFKSKRALNCFSCV
jgi:hypothetical protein